VVLLQLVITAWMILISIGFLIINFSNMKYEDDNEKSNYDYCPRVLIILPVKGLDFEFEKNLESLINQDYKNFKIVASIDDESDPAVEILKKYHIPYIIADTECNNCSGKVRAIKAVLNKFKDADVYVIADSDIRVEKTWLRNLINPLLNKEIGISTTFPSFYPEGGFWTKVKMVWGLVGESMMSSQLTRFAWGGSLAFRKDLIDDTFMQKFEGNISDDIAILRIAKDKGLKIHYAKNSRVNVHSDDDFKKFFEWSNRQTALSIKGSEKVFIFGIIYYFAMIFLILASLVLAYKVSLWYLIFLAIPLLISLNNYRKVVKRSLIVIPITFFLFFFYPINLLIGNSKKEITWRGRSYRLR